LTSIYTGIFVVLFIFVYYFIYYEKRYGKNFKIDAKEAFFYMKLCSYNSSFIDQKIYQIQKYNLFASLLDIEYKTYESWVRFFNFMSSLGLEGYGFSTIRSTNYHILSLNNLKLT